jgi:hypothetical protein
MNNTDNDMVRLLKKLRKRGVELSLLRTGTLQFTNFHLVTKEENAAVGRHYAAIVAHLKAHTPAKPTKAKPPKEDDEELEIPAEWLDESLWQASNESAAFTSLGSVTLRTSPLSGIALRATLFGIVQEKVARRLGK